MNEFSALKLVAMRSPAIAFADDETIAGQWRELNYHQAPNFAAAVVEFDRMTAIIRATGAEIIELDGFEGQTLDAIYVRDCLVATPKGVVRTHMGKAARQAEPAAAAKKLADHGVQTIGTITAPGKLEGGDLVWMDDRTVLVGIGYRTNRAGADQLAHILGADVDVIGFDLPHFKGPGDVFHLMSVLSPLDRDLALVYLPLMPVRLVEWLSARGVEFVPVVEDEFETMATNVLALGSRHVVAVSGNPRAQAAMEAAGCTVEVMAGDHLCRPGEGGPTCLTRPLRRA